MSLLLQTPWSLPDHRCNLVGELSKHDDVYWFTVAWGMPEGYWWLFLVENKINMGFFSDGGGGIVVILIYVYNLYMCR